MERVTRATLQFANGTEILLDFISCDSIDEALAKLRLVATGNARPTADLGDDGEMEAELRALAERQRNERGDYLYRGEADAILERAADRLILYREAREQLSNALLSGTLSMTEHMVCIHFESRADAEAMFVTLEGAALTHVENEGQ